MYNLIPSDNYTVPPEAEGDESQNPQQGQEQADSRRLTILRKEDEPLLQPMDQVEPASISTGATTRRHKSSPSLGSRVTTISESAEDTEEAPESPPQTKETEPQLPTEPANDPPNVIVQSPTQSTDSQVTVAEVVSDDEAPVTNETAPAAKDEEVDQPTENIQEAAQEEPPAAASEDTKSETPPEGETKPANPESKPDQEPEAEPEQKNEHKDNELDSIKEK